jgi:cytochrome c-type biogenesis protein CcmF
MGVGPLLGWRHTSLAAFRKQFTWPIITASGCRRWSFSGPQLLPDDRVGDLRFVPWPPSCRSMCAASGAARHHRRESSGGDGQPVEPQRPALWRLHRAPGMVLIGVAVIGNEFYKQTTTVTLAVGEHVALGGFDLEYAGLETNRESNLTEFVARMVVYNEGSNTPLDTVTPRRNIYDKTPDMPTSEVGLRMTPIEDVYVVLNGWDDRGATATFTIYVNPLTMWMWVGGLVLALGTLIAIWPHPTRKHAESTQPFAYATGD